MRKFELVKDEFRKHEEVELPERSTGVSAGYDFVMPCDLVVPANGVSKLVMTDIKVKMEEDEVLMLYIRSSLGLKRGLNLANGTGVIDSDYYGNESNDGNIGLMLVNRTNDEVVLKKGEKVMQGVFMKYLLVDGDSIGNGKSRSGGIGSTGA